MSTPTFVTGGFDLPTLHRKFIGFDPIFDELSRVLAGSNKGDNYPPHNIYRTGPANYFIEVAVAGFAEDELDVTITGRVLSISGEKKIDANTLEREFLHRGISGRDFCRQFTLGQNVELKTASVKNGILVVELEHVVPEEEQPKKIAIKFNK